MLLLVAVSCFGLFESQGSDAAITLTFVSIMGIGVALSLFFLTVQTLVYDDRVVVRLYPWTFFKTTLNRDDIASISIRHKANDIPKKELLVTTTGGREVLIVTRHPAELINAISTVNKK